MRHRPAIASKDEWLSSHEAMLGKEKALTAAHDRLAAERRCAPWMEVQTSYRFKIFRTYFSTGRGVETLGTAFTFLDLTPLGRQETWEDSPPGVSQSEPYLWWRLHDEYATDE